MNCAVTISASAADLWVFRAVSCALAITEKLIYLPPKSFGSPTISHHNRRPRYTCRTMSTSLPSTTQVLSGPSQELRDNTGYLLKKLGFAIKERSFEAYEATGLTPQHHAVLSVL